MKCEHCGYTLIQDEDGWHHKGATWYRRNDEVCYENRIEKLEDELLEAKARIYKLTKVCNKQIKSVNPTK